MPHAHSTNATCTHEHLSVSEDFESFNQELKKYIQLISDVHIYTCRCSDSLRGCLSRPRPSLPLPVLHSARRGTPFFPWVLRSVPYQNSSLTAVNVLNRLRLRSHRRHCFSAAQLLSVRCTPMELITRALEYIINQGTPCLS